MLCDPTGDALMDPEREEAIDRAEHDAYRRMMDMVAVGGFDLVHNNALHALPLQESARLGLPWVTVLHTPPFEALVRGIVKADPDMAFLAVSPSLAQEWATLVPDAQVVDNGVDLSTFAFNAVADAKPYAFWSGRIVPEKGLHLAIDAARAAGLPLVFAGPKLNPAYWEAEIAPRLGPDLTHLGHLSHRDLAHHLAGPGWRSCHRAGRNRSASWWRRRWPAARRSPPSVAAPCPTSSTRNAAGWPIPTTRRISRWRSGRPPACRAAPAATGPRRSTTPPR